MSEIQLTLSGVAAETLKRLTEEGGFATPEAAIEALLEAERPIDPAVERWLRDVAVARFDAARADPGRAVSLDEARRRLSE